MEERGVVRPRVLTKTMGSVADERRGGGRSWSGGEGCDQTKSVDQHSGVRSRLEMGWGGD